jgi:hypothetical protein
MKLPPRLTSPIARRVVLPLRRRIQTLVWVKWLAFPGLALLALVVFPVSGMTLLFGLICVLLHVAINAWEASVRRQFVRDAGFPRYLGAKLRAQYPQLSASDTDLVLHGLRQFFMAHLRSKRQFVAMPSAVVDAAWHEFILHTRAYQDWCHIAFGKLMHHTPAEVLGRDPNRNDGLRRTWYWACKEESINPRQPSRLPLLFALDKKFAITGGFTYVPDCKDIDRQSGSDAYCGTSFGDGGDGGGSSGDAGGFGGSESSGADGSSDGDGGGDGGCGGGCGGGD